MNRRLLIVGLVAGLAVAAPALSGGALATPDRSAPVRIEELNQLPAAYARHNREHRMWEIQRNLELQQRAQGRHQGYGPRRGYGYERGRYGYERAPRHYRQPGYERGWGSGYGPGFNNPNSGSGYSR
ncbi:hypothetical protein [Bosea sp. NPDC055594]